MKLACISILVTVGDTKEVNHGPFLKLLMEMGDMSLERTRKYDRLWWT